MAVTIEYREGQFYIVDGLVRSRALFPKDAQHQSAPVSMGLDYATGTFIPIGATSDGKLKVDASIVVEDIEIGAVELKDHTTDTRVNVEADGAKNAVYVQSLSLAKDSTLTGGTQKTKVIDNSGNVIDSTDVTGVKSLNVYVKGGMPISVALSHTTDSISIWGTDGTDDRKIKTNVAGVTLIDDSPMGKQNITSDYTYYVAGPGTGKVQTIKEYPTGAAGGAPAKLTTYTYDGSARVSSIVVSDTTV